MTIAELKTDIPLHWHNSANVLCNYMKELKFLEMILQNQAIIPRYVIEPLGYLNINGLKQIAFPMTCFCDIPFSKVGSHMSQYGRYGIAFDKQKFMKKFKVQPIHYINPSSPLADDFREAFSKYYRQERRVNEDDKVLLNYIVSTLAYMKPISGENGDIQQYVFQDECEWRYTPNDGFPDSLDFFIKEDQISEKGRNAYSDVLKDHQETWINFDWADVRYIIVPDDVSLKKIIDVIMKLHLVDSEKYVLISKIEISTRFTEDLS